MADGPLEFRREGRFSDRAAVLTVAAFILLTPPILSIFDVPVLIFGVPLLHVYSFAVWLAAIGLGFLLTRRAYRGDSADGARPPPDQPGGS